MAKNVAKRDAALKQGEIINPEVDGFPPGRRPLCPFCSEPWDEEMIRVFDIDASHGEGSYDFGPEDQQATVDITCSSCKRLIYRKEYRAHGLGR